MMEVSIPDEWAVIEYGDVLTSVSNGIGGKQNKDGSGIPVSRIETIAHETINFSRVGFIEIYDANKVEKYKINKGDILFSHINSPTHLGKTAIFDKDRELYHGINLLRLVVNKKCMIARFFNYHCKFSRKAGIFSQNAQHAVNQSSINQKKLSRFKVPLPPLAEQKIIADKLDSLLAQVENTKARLERIPEVLKRFRQSVLAAAVSGRLTANGETNDRNWPLTRLSNLCTTAFDGPFGSKLKSSDYTDDGVGVVRLENIKHLRFDQSKETFISKEKYLTLEKNKLHKDDLLFSSFVDEEIRACLFPFETLRFINKADCFCLRIDQKKALPEFVLYLLTSQYSYAQIKEHVQGVTRPRVNLKILKSLEFPIPPKDEQTEIVRRVDQLFAHADRIEEQVNQALARVNNLTQSILAKAFRGELTEQWRKDHPELISGENSASALLERIKAERAAKAPAKRRKRSA